VSPAYDIVAPPAVANDLERLPRTVETRIGARIDALTTNPRSPGVRSITGHPGYYRLRVGDYGVIYSVDDAEREVTIVIVGHRRDVYDRMERRL
jgi:mRNA interferase RelE/StbE